MARRAATSEDEVFRFAAGDRRLSGLWRKAPDAHAICLIAHGAGNDMRNRLFEGIAEGLGTEAVSSMRFNFPFTEEGRRGPDRPPVLIGAWQAALEEAARRAGGLPIVASGKSLGGRMVSVLAANDPDGFPAKAIVFFGYPLHAPGRTHAPRDAHLSSIRVPMLFIQGTSDPLAEIGLMRDVVKRLGRRAKLDLVEGGDHSFRVRGVRRPDEEIGRDLARVASNFIKLLHA